MLAPKPITNAKANIEKIQGFQGQILNSTSTTQEDATIRAREKLITDTRNLLVESKDRIRTIQSDNVRLPSTDPNLGLRQQRYEYLRTKLSSVLEEYRQAEIRQGRAAGRGVQTPVDAIPS